jgi:5-methylcytosine-specific restriction enzyme A
MSSRHVRATLLTMRAAEKYGPTIRETAALLEELIALVKQVDPLSRRTAWPEEMLVYLYNRQDGICPVCGRTLDCENRKALHVDHLVPFAQGGENSIPNIRLLHARCNLSKGDECHVDDVILHLKSRLLNLRALT